MVPGAGRGDTRCIARYRLAAPDARRIVPRCTPQALQLLGREFRHAIFDALHFDAAAFAALKRGPCKPGSWLLLLMPPYETRESRLDTDYLRWSADRAQPIPTPNAVCTSILNGLFPAIRKRCCMTAPAVLLTILSFRGTAGDLATGEPQPSRRLSYRVYVKCRPAWALLQIAPWARGKSALAGQFISGWRAARLS